jgi:hypothetical protein
LGYREYSQRITIMNLTYWTTLALTLASCGLLTAYALHTLDGGTRARRNSTATAEKSDQLERVGSQTSRIYLTLQSPSPGGSTLSRVAIEAGTKDISRARL